jgi:hypothetical protein
MEKLIWRNTHPKLGTNGDVSIEFKQKSLFNAKES